MERGIKGGMRCLKEVLLATSIHANVTGSRVLDTLNGVEGFVIWSNKQQPKRRESENSTKYLNLALSSTAPPPPLYTRECYILGVRVH